MTTILLAAVLLTAAPETTLLQFSATWCGPCRQMEPVCQQFAAQGYPLHKIDIDREPAVAKSFNVNAVPTFVVLVDGREMERREGTLRLDSLIALYRRHTTVTPPMVDVTRPQLVANDWRPARAMPACDLPPIRPPLPDGPPPVMPRPVPVNPPKACDDCDKLRESIAELRAEIANLKRQPGEPGAKGERGPPGEPGAPGVSPSAEKIAASVASKVKPCQCEPVKPSEPATHFVVVSDEKNPDARRLSSFVSDAQKAYSGIRVAGLPPFPIGQIPQLVQYSGATPIKTFKGRREVEEVLHRIARGEYPPAG